MVTEGGRAVIVSSTGAGFFSPGLTSSVEVAGAKPSRRASSRCWPGSSAISQEPVPHCLSSIRIVACACDARTVIFAGPVSGGGTGFLPRRYQNAPPAISSTSTPTPASRGTFGDFFATGGAAGGAGGTVARGEFGAAGGAAGALDAAGGAGGGVAAGGLDAAGGGAGGGVAVVGPPDAGRPAGGITGGGGGAGGAADRGGSGGGSAAVFGSICSSFAAVPSRNFCIRSSHLDLLELVADDGDVGASGGRMTVAVASTSAGLEDSGSACVSASCTTSDDGAGGGTTGIVTASAIEGGCSRGVPAGRIAGGAALGCARIESFVASPALLRSSVACNCCSDFSFG